MCLKLPVGGRGHQESLLVFSRVVQWREPKLYLTTEHMWEVYLEKGREQASEETGVVEERGRHDRGLCTGRALSSGGGL